MEVVVKMKGWKGHGRGRGRKHRKGALCGDRKRRKDGGRRGLRKYRGAVGAGGARGASYRVKWGRVDWDEQDVKIAKDFGCSRERVRQKRKELGVGRSPLWHKRPGCAADVIAGMSTGGMCLKEVARSAGCSAEYALSVLARLGKAYIRHDRRAPLKWRWDLADWSLTDRGVARLLGIPNHNVVSQYRYRHGIVKVGHVVVVKAKTV